jgi:hypothetical protein
MASAKYNVAGPHLRPKNIALLSEIHFSPKEFNQEHFSSEAVLPDER